MYTFNKTTDINYINEEENEVIEELGLKNVKFLSIFLNLIF